MHIRSSSSGAMPQIEILQSERTLLTTPISQSALFKTFTEMPKALAFSKDIQRVPSPKARLLLQLTHNRSQREQIISQITERHKEAISEVIVSSRHTKQRVRIVAKLRRRESPPRKLTLKQGAKVYQMPNLAVPTTETEVEHPPQLTFYSEAQEFLRTYKNFRPSFTEGGAMSLYGDSIYLYGGIAGDGLRDQILKYDLRYQEWHNVITTGEQPKEGRAALSVVVLRSHFIYFGGQGKFNGKLKVRECFNTVFDYNASTKNWEKANTQGDYIEPRRHHKACQYGWKWMLVYGGIGGNEEVLSDTAIYNIEKMIWKQWQVKSTPICCHSMINISISNKFNENTTDVIPAENIFTFGGKNQDGISTNQMKKLTFYPNTTTAISWEVIQTNGKPPLPCHNHTMEYIKKIGGIIIIGGLRDQLYEGTLESKDIHVFYPNINIWQQVIIEGNNVPRCAHNSVLLSSKIAIFGGIGNGRYLEPLIYYIETDQQQVSGRVAKEQFAKRQTQYMSQKYSLEKLENLNFTPRDINSFHSDTKRTFKSNKRIILPSNTRSYLPQKKQVLIRYDILIGFVQTIIRENIDVLNNM